MIECLSSHQSGFVSHWFHGIISCYHLLQAPITAPSWAWGREPCLWPWTRPYTIKSISSAIFYKVLCTKNPSRFSQGFTKVILKDPSSMMPYLQPSRSAPGLTMNPCSGVLLCFSGKLLILRTRFHLCSWVQGRLWKCEQMHRRCLAPWLLPSSFSVKDSLFSWSPLHSMITVNFKFSCPTKGQTGPSESTYPLW
jgi:hypothetical protein